MNERQRQLAFLRFMEIEVELEALSDGRVVDGDPATVEGELLEEQDEIEFRAGRGLLGAPRVRLTSHANCSWTILPGLVPVLHGRSGPLGL